MTWKSGSVGFLATPLRLALYALVLVAVFLGAFGLGRIAAPGGQGDRSPVPPVATHTAGAHEPGEADDDEH